MDRRLAGLHVMSVRLLALAFVLLASAGVPASAEDQPLPELTEPVNDFAHVIDAATAAQMDRLIRALKSATGDVIVVATVDTVAPYADINEYAVKLFENHGKGIGEKGKDNGLLMLLAVRERRVRMEVGYALEPYITDGFAGETSREVMVPYFRRGEYGKGLAAGLTRLVGRLAEARHVTIEGAPPPQPLRTTPSGGTGCLSPFVIIGIIIVFLIISRFLQPPGVSGRGGRWGSGSWSGWSSGVGPFGGGFGGGWGGGGGGFGGGFGGFGGGRSGGGGGGAGW